MLVLLCWWVVVVQAPMVGKYSVDIAKFESIALPILKANEEREADQKQAHHDFNLFIIDEIGKMEVFSQPFIEAVLNIVKNNKNVVLASIPSLK